VQHHRNCVPSEADGSSPERRTSPLNRWALIGLAIFEVLNLLNFCYLDMRFHSEEYWIDIAVRENLRLHAPYGDRDKIYSSLDDFYLENPACCHVIYLTNLFYRPHVLEVSPLTRLLCIEEFLVNVRYKISDIREKDRYYDSFVRMNACGDILTTMGSLDDRAPNNN
jgi:hypothetical protein